MSERPQERLDDALRRRADPRTNTMVKVVLRIGLLSAMVLLVTGLAVQLASGDHSAVGVRMFDLFAPRSVGVRIMAVGVLALAVTPVGGVMTVIVGWSRERDRTYVGVGLIVLTVLAAAVVVGLG